MVKLHAIVNLDESGEIKCFCSYDSYLRGQCACRDKYDCPEAVISIDVLPNSRPSDEKTAEVRKASKVVGKAAKDFDKQVTVIKKGLANLEKSVRKTKFRF